MSGVLSEIANFILHSRRAGTQKQYSTFTSEWFKFSCWRSNNTFHLDTETVLESLNKLFKQKVGKGALNRVRSSLLLFLEIDTLPVGKQPLVKKIL